MATLDPRYLEMRAWADAHDDEPDGAFFAMAEELMGWDVEDWAWYATQSKLDPRYATSL